MRIKDDLGKPDILIEGLEIWIHGRERPNTVDYWDGDWLRATAHCGAKGSEVWVSGPILHLSEIKSWLENLEKINSTLSGRANLDCMEPELKVEMSAESLGQVLMRVEISPDQLRQFPSFEFETDQSYLPHLIKELKEVLGEYSIKGTP